MDPRTSERIGWGTIAAAALGVGVLLGARFCAPPPGGRRARGLRAPRHEGSASGCAERTAPSGWSRGPWRPSPGVIYECPPEPEPEPAEEPVAVARKEELPEPEPPMDPLTRQRLLAWVRDQSEELEVCRDEAPEIYRLAVILHLEREGKARGCAGSI